MYAINFDFLLLNTHHNSFCTIKYTSNQHEPSSSHIKQLWWYLLSVLFIIYITIVNPEIIIEDVHKYMKKALY